MTFIVVAAEFPPDLQNPTVLANSCVRTSVCDSPRDEMLVVV